MGLEAIALALMTGQTVPIPPAEVDPVIVTAARLPTPLSEAGFSTVQLENEALENADRLDEVLTALPGVSLFRRSSSQSANPTTQGLSLRSIAPSGAGRALVTLDGVPLNDPFGGWVVWTQAPVEAIAGATVIRGGGSGPYGAGALTGTVALTERDEGPRTNVTIWEAGGMRLGAWGGRRGATSGLSGSLMVERNDGFTPVRGPAAGGADVPASLEASSAAARLDLLATGGARLSLRASAWSEDRGSGLVGGGSSSSGQLISATLTAPLDADGLGRLQVWTHGSTLSNAFVAVAADRSSTTPASNQDETPARGWGLNLAYRRRLDGDGYRSEWEIGGDIRFASGETRERSRFLDGAFTRSRRAGGQTTVGGLYGEGSWSASSWLLVAGARHDRWRSAGGRRFERDLASGAPTLDLNAANASGRVFSFRAAAIRDIGPLDIRVAAYTSFRPATLNELHRPFRVGNDITEANAALQPERVRGIEVALSDRGTGWRWSMTAFRNEIEDAIVNVTIGEGPGVFPVAGFVPADGVLRQRQNAGTIEATGFEAEGELAVGSVEYSLQAAWTDAFVDGGLDAPQLTGLRPAQAPQWALNARMKWNVSPRLSLAASVRHESARFDDDLNTRRLAAATTFDLRAEWRLTDQASVWIAVDNALDAEIETSRTGSDVVGYDAPRRIGVGLSWIGP